MVSVPGGGHRLLFVQSPQPGPQLLPDLGIEGPKRFIAMRAGRGVKRTTPGEA